MKCLTVPIALLLALSLPAQISIHQGDMPSPGDTVRYVNSLAAQIDPGDTGPGHLWDFSTLTPMLPGADTVVAVTSTPFLYQIFFNNPFLYPEHRAQLAMRGADLDFQVVSFTNLYEYYANDEAGYRNVGFGATMSGLPVSVQNEPIDIVYRFPLEFGDTDSSASAFEIEVPTLGFLGRTQIRRNEVDGWGTLILPADTFEVVRVMSRIERTDTVYVDQFGFGFTIPEPETIEYKWLANGMDRPVLEVITVAGLPVIARFHHEVEEITTSVVAPVSPEFRLYPNPAQDQLRIQTPQASVIRIHAADGRLVRTQRLIAGAQWVDVSALVPGVYTVLGLGASGSTRLVIAR
ncbi:MAG TPA: T9SS type A sorting domain-containing protein [Flavobacteriales bacterium]